LSREGSYLLLSTTPSLRRKEENILYRKSKRRGRLTGVVPSDIIVV
jgi:hypothetical protein